MPLDLEPFDIRIVALTLLLLALGCAFLGAMQ